MCPTKTRVTICFAWSPWLSTPRLSGALWALKNAVLICPTTDSSWFGMRTRGLRNWILNFGNGMDRFVTYWDCTKLKWVPLSRTKGLIGLVRPGYIVRTNFVDLSGCRRLLHSSVAVIDSSTVQRRSEKSSSILPRRNCRFCHSVRSYDSFVFVQ